MPRLPNTAQVLPAPADLSQREQYSLIVGKSLGLKYFHIDPKSPTAIYVMQWNLNVQRPAYFRSCSGRSHTLALVRCTLPQSSSDANFVVPTLTSAGLLWPAPIGSGTTQNTNPNVGRIDYSGLGGDGKLQRASGPNLPRGSAMAFWLKHRTRGSKSTR